MIDYRFGVVRRGEKGAEIPYYEDVIGIYYKEAKSYPDSIHFLLQNGNSPVQPDPNIRHFQLIKQARNWNLYKNVKLN